MLSDRFQPQTGTLGEALQAALGASDQNEALRRFVDFAHSATDLRTMISVAGGGLQQIDEILSRVYDSPQHLNMRGAPNTLASRYQPEDLRLLEAIGAMLPIAELSGLDKLTRIRTRLAQIIDEIQKDPFDDHTLQGSIEKALGQLLTSLDRYDATRAEAALNALAFAEKSKPRDRRRLRQAISWGFVGLGIISNSATIYDFVVERYQKDVAAVEKELQHAPMLDPPRPELQHAPAELTEGKHVDTPPDGLDSDDHSIN